MIDLSPQELMTVLGLASKVCEFEQQFSTGLAAAGQPMEALQLEAAVTQVVPILARLDRDYPGMVAVPHDGVGWASRV